MSERLDAAGLAAQFNTLYPVGTAVQFWPGIKHGPGTPAITRGPAEVREGRYGTPVVPLAGRGEPVALADIEVVRPYIQDPCLCGVPREEHGLRYAAIFGEHEWRDPHAKPVRVVAPASDRQPVEATSDPYEPQPDREDRNAWAREDRNEKPAGLFARIAAAAARRAA